MLTKLWTALEGYKTYLLAGLGIIVALTGHFWGPITLGSVQIPAMSWNEVWAIIWNGGLISALRHGIEKTNP